MIVQIITFTIFVILTTLVCLVIMKWLEKWGQDRYITYKLRKLFETDERKENSGILREASEEGTERSKQDDEGEGRSNLQETQTDLDD